ncbi:MAG: TIM barrel protein [Verrucomicrobia bacterium]|nr:TIM barrel protein [Verrucomicrobiota bacterium]
MKPEFTPSSPVSRRGFVSLLALGAAAAPLTAAIGRAEAAPAVKPVAILEPLGPTVVHVFSKPMHQMSHAETAKLLAECGVGGIDYTVRKAQGHVLPDKVAEELPRAIDAAHAAGLKVEMITTEITSVRDPHAEATLRTAAKYGVKCYRLGNWNYDAKLGVLGTFEKIKPALNELAALNASLGIHGAIQNHSGTRIGSPVWDLYHLLRDIDPRALGVQYDIRHATTEGGQSWPLALKLIRPWIRCTDMKDFRWQQAPGKATVEGMPLGEGIVPLDAYFKLAKELAIVGPMSVHLEYPPFERGPKFASAAEQRAAFVTALKKDMAVLKGLMTKHQIT